MITITFKRGNRIVKRAETSGTGTRNILVRDRRLRPGRYRVQVRATDVAGNRSPLRTAPLSIRR